MKKIAYSLLLTSTLFHTGCKKFIDVNQDPNRPMDVQESLILPAVELGISHNVHAGFASVLGLHYTQAVAINQPTPNYGTYFLVNSDLDAHWSDIYAYLNNLAVLNNKAGQAERFNYAGIAKILTAYTLGYTTSMWGDIPYSQAFKGTDKLTPVYDKQEDVYKTIQTLLDNGIADINKNHALNPGTADLFYEGEMDKWKRLAYTLKARYYMHLTKAPGYTASTQADLALAALQNGMQSAADDLKMEYPGTAGNENPWYTTFLPNTTLVLSSYTVEALKNRNDPRLPYMIAPAQTPTSGAYNGKTIGVNDIGSLESYSLPGEIYAGADATNYLVTYMEALFLKAEATFIKSGAAAAQPIFQEAIKLHMHMLGVSNTYINNYLATWGILSSNNGLQRIIEEKTVANFLSPENFTDWRRTGYPLLSIVPNATTTQIPRRMLYPQVEKISNPQVQQSAPLTDKVWWDK